MPHRARRAISEIVSSLILLVIAVSLGAAVVVWASNYSSLVLGGMAENLDRARYALMEVPVIEHAIINATSNNVTLWVSNEGSIDLEIDAIYIVNDTVLEYNNTFYVRGETGLSLVDKLPLKPTEMKAVTANITEFRVSSGSRYVVTIVTSSGNRAGMLVVAAE